RRPRAHDRGRLAALAARAVGELPVGEDRVRPDAHIALDAGPREQLRSRHHPYAVAENNALLDAGMRADLALPADRCPARYLRVCSDPGAGTELGAAVDHGKLMYGPAADGFES